MKIHEGYLLLLVVIIFIGVMLLVSGENWQYGGGDLRGTQTDYGINKTLVQEISDSVNITKAIEDFDNFTCCYPYDCPQAMNNPKDCDCIYAVECYEE